MLTSAGMRTDRVAAAIRTIEQLSHRAVGSEDDLIHKIILPFFQLMGYGPDSLQLKFPVEGYRPNRRGRKPEADCVFFSGPAHDRSSSLLVAEIKRDAVDFPEQQARFYSINLYTPFYIAWSNLSFEIWRVRNFMAPLLMGRYKLNDIDRRTFSELMELLAPDHIVKYCIDTQIKHFDLDEKRKAIEAHYLEHMRRDLRSFKALDLPHIAILRNTMLNLV
jgi:hypothetical protein